MGNRGRIPVEAQGQLGEVIGTDRKTVEVLKKLRRKDRIGGDFAHHNHFEPIFSTYQAVRG